MQELTIKLHSFEGPIDLLLHLIKELELDIYDIPMVELTQQYLSYLHSMKEMQLEVAGDYLVMAATLLEIKARMLLPKPKMEVADEEYVDPRQDLVERLIEYKQFQASAKALEELSIKRSSYFAKESTDLSGLQQAVPLREGELSTQDLWNALKKLAQKTMAKQPLRANIYHEAHTVEELMTSILSKLTTSQKGKVAFIDCFPELNRHAIVTTFLAMLQLVRSRSITITQRVPYEEIYITKVEGNDDE